MNNSTMTIQLMTLALMTAICTNCAKSNKNTASASQDSVAGIVYGNDIKNTDLNAGGVANPVVGIVVDFDGPIDPKTGAPTPMMAICTGTLIAPDMILTAGHCVGDGATAEKMHVFFQATALGASQPSVTVKSFLANPAYVQDTKDSKDDVALLRLTNPAPSSVTPATLTNPALDIAHAVKLTMGYGQSDDRQDTPSERNGAGVLRWTMAMDGSDLVTEAEDPSKSALGMIEVNSTLTGTCHGDSGGPLFAVDPTTKKFVVAGITEAGIPMYKGQQAADFKNVLNAIDPQQTKQALADFYTKYPDAHICSGLSLFVNVANQMAWIQQAMTTLHAQP